MVMFEAGKEYLTRDGRRARVYATDGGLGSMIHGAIRSSIDGEWFASEWPKDGRRTDRIRGDDLIPPRPPVVVSDAVSDAAHDAFHCCGEFGRRLWKKTAAAAITAYLAEQEPL
jgi:hypothetical protein